MKLAICHLIVMVMMVLGSCNASHVPDMAKKSLDKKYPEARGVRWEEEDHEAYEAEFGLDGKKHSAKFDAAGEWIETKTIVNQSTVPDPVISAMRSGYPDAELKEIGKIERPGKPLAYEVEVEHGEELIAMMISEEGEILSKEGEKNEN